MNPAPAYAPARGLLVPQHHAGSHLAPLQHGRPQAPRGLQALHRERPSQSPSQRQKTPTQSLSLATGPGLPGGLGLDPSGPPL